MTSRIRRVHPIFPVLTACGLLVSACSPRQEAKEPAQETADSGSPRWLEAYSDAQKAVLALPLDAKVEERAFPVYPSLSHFAFAEEAPIDVPDDLVAYANLVSETLSASPRLYVSRHGPPSLANIQALFGPAPSVDPDPWQRVAVDALGHASIAGSFPSKTARKLVDKAAEGGPEALALLQDATTADPNVPGIHAMLADMALARGEHDIAEKAARAALALDPVFPHAFRVLAEVMLHQGDVDGAQDAISHALALYPTYPRAWSIAQTIVGHEIDRTPKVTQPFIEVNEAGAIVIVSCDTPFCTGYAACKAAFRFEPTFRAAVFQSPDPPPYSLSVTEEVVCLQAGLGAHADLHLLQAPEAVSDPTAELLIHLAGETGLTAFAAFEVLGPHRPEWFRIASRAVHDAIVQHIRLRVFGLPSAMDEPYEDEPITAGLGPLRLGR